MVLPAVAARVAGGSASRVAGRGVRNATMKGSSPNILEKDKYRRRPRREVGDSNTSEEAGSRRRVLSTMRRRMQGGGETKEDKASATKKALALATKARATTATVTIFGWAVPLYLFQALLSVLSIPALLSTLLYGSFLDSTVISYFDTVRNFFASLDISQAIFFFLHYFAFFIACATAIGAVLHYTFMGILDSVSGVRGIILMTTLALTFFFPLAPWLLLWVLSVIYLAE